jgi:hypothetical protein
MHVGEVPFRAVVSDARVDGSRIYSALTAMSVAILLDAAFVMNAHVEAAAKYYDEPLPGAFNATTLPSNVMRITPMEEWREPSSLDKILAYQLPTFEDNKPAAILYESCEPLFIAIVRRRELIKSRVATLIDVHVSLVRQPGSLRAPLLGGLGAKGHCGPGAPRSAAQRQALVGLEASGRIASGLRGWQ